VFHVYAVRVAEVLGRSTDALIVEDALYRTQHVAGMHYCFVVSIGLTIDNRIDDFADLYCDWSIRFLDFLYLSIAICRNTGEVRAQSISRIIASAICNLLGVVLVGDSVSMIFAVQECFAHIFCGCSLLIGQGAGACQS
jgi:hypothetical protein